MIIGGEHFPSPEFFFRSSKFYIDNLINSLRADYNIEFTFGGYFSLLAIIDQIKPILKNDSIILLPSYLCPSLLKPFKVRKIQYRFYKVDEDLYIDTDSLIANINDRVKAVLFINYFGASQIDRLRSVIEILKKRKVIVIQDVVQCLQIKSELLYGDFIFNSFRKFFPFEGSIILAKEKMNIAFCDNKYKYLINKRIGQFFRYFHVNFGLLSSNVFLNYLNKAESYYYSNEIKSMPKFNIIQLNKYHIESIVKKQKYYFDLLKVIYPNKVPKLLINNSFVPLGFVIKLENRDCVRKFLFERNIFAPIHWILSPEIDQIEFPESVKLSSIILTIPLIGMTDQKFEYLLNNLKNLFKNESLS